MWERRIKFLQELIDSPLDVLGSTWPCLLFMLIITGVPVWLAKKKFSERENLKWKVYVLMLPAICLAFFCLLFCGEKAYYEFTLDGVFTWLGLTFFVWFVLLPFFMIEPAFFRRDTNIWDNTNYHSEVEENIDDLFDMAMKVGREKREGKDTSKQEAEYNRKVESLDKNGYIDEHQDF